MSVDEANRKARREAEMALKLDPDLAVAHARMGSILRVYDWDWKGADASMQRALQLDSGNASVLQSAAGLACTMGRFEEAITLQRRAIELDPLNTGAHYYLGLYLLYLGRLKVAESEFRKSLELNLQYPAAHMNIGSIYLMQSKLEAALAEIQIEPDPDWRLYGLALAYYRAGKKKEADAALNDYIERNRNKGELQIAEIYAFRNESDKTFEWLDRAYKQRDSGLSLIKGDPILSKLSGDSRWAAFLNKMHLPVD